MNTNDEIKKIKERIERIEKIVFSDERPVNIQRGKKAPSLPELVKVHPLKSGQQRVAAIVGYLEKIEKKESIQLVDMRNGWKTGKFNGSFANVFVTRALRDGLINDYSKDGNYALTQSGEKFWEELNK